MRDHNEVDEVSGRTKHTNMDPITAALGAHPVGTGVGAAGGGAAGAALGAVAGPVGAGIGLVVGAVVGGLGGKGVAEMIDPTVEDAYWRKEYSSTTYVEKGVPYDTYKPAYQIGYEGYNRYPGRKFEDVESDLQRDYEKSRGNSTLPWDKAKEATRDAWHRVDKAGATGGKTMRKNHDGKARNWILLWALGIPIPILLILFVLRGCT